MTSSDTKPKRRRRWPFWAAAGLLLAAALYSLAWFQLAATLRSRLSAPAVTLAGGATVKCARVVVSGFPFRLALRCDPFDAAGPAGTVAAGAVEATARLLNPFRVRLRLAGPARIERAGLVPLTIDWNEMRGRVSLVGTVVSGVALFGKGIAVQATLKAPGQAVQPVPLATIGGAAGRARLDGADLHVSATFDRLALDAGLAPAGSPVSLADLPPLTGSVEAGIPEGVRLIGQPLRTLRGRSVRIERLFLAPNPASSLALAGTAAVDGDGLVDADLTLTLRNPQSLAEALAPAFPKIRQQIGNGLAMLAALGEEPVLPVVIRKGKVTVGLLSVAQIPPLP